MRYKRHRVPSPDYFYFYLLTPCVCVCVHFDISILTLPARSTSFVSTHYDNIILITRYVLMFYVRARSVIMKNILWTRGTRRAVYFHFPKSLAADSISKTVCFSFFLFARCLFPLLHLYSRII